MSDMDWSRYQDIAGQLPSLQNYTQFCLLFPAHDKDIITKLVEETSVKLASIFPWLSGRVVNEGNGPESSGIFRVLPYRCLGTGLDIYQRDEPALEYQDIVRRGAPMAMLDGESFSPKWDLTRMSDLAKDIAPVLALQLTFLKGGLVMAFAAAHNAMDMSGLGKLIELFGKIARGEEVSKDEIEWGNKDRRELFTLLGPKEVELDHSMLTTDPAGKGREGQLEDKPPTKARWAYIRFTKEKLVQLKNKASSQESDETTDKPDSTRDWISTDDAISALLWQRITLSRLPRLWQIPSSSPAEDTIKCTLCRAINARRFLVPRIPPSYMGHMVSCTFTSIPFHALETTSLSTIASELRNTLNEQGDHSMRSFFTFIHKHRDKRRINFASRMDLTQDLLISSGAGLGVYKVDFGPQLGMPELVRRPRWDLTEGIAYLLPKTRDGDVDVALCLSESDWARLEADEIWNDFGEYIG